jgi:hypothetical protein
MMRSVDARMAVLGGTFVPDNYSSSGRYCASTAFFPDIADEEEGERLHDPLRCRFVPIEDVPDFDADSPFLRVTGEIEDEEEVA